jgi:hypothetical protein
MGHQPDWIDWSGVAPDQSPIERLNARTFAARLRLLGERAEALTVLRQAMSEQRSRGEPLPRDSEPAPRSSR